MRLDAGVVGFALCYVVSMMKSVHSHGFPECRVATVLEVKHGIDLYIVELKGFSKFSHRPVQGQMSCGSEGGCWVPHSTLRCRLPAG